MHARVVEPFAPHVHDEFAVGVCTEGTELIRYRGGLHHAGPGSVVILEPGVPHTGGPEQPPAFVYRVMYPGTGLLAEGLRPGQPARPPRFRQPVVADPALAGELWRLHARLSRGAEPLEAESRLVWLLAALVDRHASGVSGGCDVRNAYGVAREVMTRLADQAAGPPGLTELAAAAGMSRYQLLRSFQAEVGMPPYAWLAQYRVARARALLDRGHRPAQAAALAGFADQAHLTRWFRRVVGVTPGTYCNSVQDRPPAAPA
jgi:AraC-like DNA-binding protein